MSVIIRCDEMIDALSDFDRRAAQRYQRSLEAVASEAACTIARHYGIRTAPATHQGSDVAGCAAPFRPAYYGQPLPPGFDTLDHGAADEWADEMRALRCRWPGADVAPLPRPFDPSQDGEGTRVVILNGGGDSPGRHATVIEFRAGDKTLQLEFDDGERWSWDVGGVDALGDLVTDPALVAGWHGLKRAPARDRYPMRAHECLGGDVTLFVDGLSEWWRLEFEDADGNVREWTPEDVGLEARAAYLHDAIREAIEVAELEAVDAACRARGEPL